MIRTLKIPDLTKDKARSEFAFRICLEMRKRSSTQNFEEAEFHLFEHHMDIILHEINLKSKFASADDFEDFKYEICEAWPDSASGNRWRLTTAISNYEEEPDMYPDHRLTFPKLRNAATLCWFLAEQHGGPDAIFYISSRTLAEAISVSRNTGNRILGALVKTYGILEIVEKHTRGRRLATSYRFTRKGMEIGRGTYSTLHTLHSPLSTTHYELPETRQREAAFGGNRKENNQPAASPENAPQAVIGYKGTKPVIEVDMDALSLAEFDVATMLHSLSLPATKITLRNAMALVKAHDMEWLDDELRMRIKPDDYCAPLKWMSEAVEAMQRRSNP